MYLKTKEDHVGWKAETATYNSKHKWMTRNYPHPEKCSKCKTPGELQKGKWSIDYANISGHYLRHTLDWIPLCRKCHRGFDKKETSFVCIHCKQTITGLFSKTNRSCQNCQKLKQQESTKLWKRRQKMQ